MQWIDKKPKINTVRYIQKFAWIPTRFSDAWVWLEAYVSKEKYCKSYTVNDWGHVEFTSPTWVELNRKRKINSKVKYLLKGGIS